MGIFSRIILPVVAAAALAVSTFTAEAVPVSPTTAPAGPDIEYDYGVLSNDTFTDTAVGINLEAARISLVELIGNGSGSLTISTFVDPFINGGVGAANILVGLAGPLAPGSVTVSWGGGPTFDLSSGLVQQISTSFTTAGLAGAKDLVFSWTDISNVQISSQLAAVPLPAAGLLLLGGLGGLVVMRRRRKAA